MIRVAMAFLAVLVLSGCVRPGIVAKLITADMDAARAFQRECLSAPGRTITVHKVGLKGNALELFCWEGNGLDGD